MKNILFTVIVLFISLGSLQAQEITNKGRFSGYMFGDYFYNAARDTGITYLSNVANGGKKDLNGIQLRRIYFTYDYDISESFITRFRLEADQAANTSNNKIGVFVKDAYLQWKNIFKGSDLIFGIQPTPAFEVSEGIWGNRFLEKTIMDLRGIVSSRDLAVTLKGKLDNEGMFKYWLMVGNGSGNSPETDKYKRFYAHLQYSPVKQFTTTLYADLKARPDINDPTSTSIPPATLSNNDLTYALFLGYKGTDVYSLGVEGFLTQRQNGMISGTEIKDKTGMGLSVFASYNFSKELAAVGRYDYYDPNSDSDVKGDSRNWFIFSLNYKPDAKVTISPNVIIETYESLPNGRSIDASITPRITFFYSFL
ncbi:outer membrane beta-barrel protein [Melioribacter sp. OK-6-Me]|uniref:outer membrane beta-barrel protein n=1 Tax=unclassified Melioribacter TaxID=2627329 RepID=UPI003ED995AF